MNLQHQRQKSSLPLDSYYRLYHNLAGIKRWQAGRRVWEELRRNVRKHLGIPAPTIFGFFTKSNKFGSGSFSDADPCSLRQQPPSI